ncbi:MAG: hypothetical protein QF368_05365 [SAR202 cluster bacterium]|jgi:hypothetical protein|nr:hypothetical protein [SAR202 cluster bacterium]
MVAITTSSQKLNQARKQDPAIDVVIEQTKTLLGSLVKSDNPKRMRANVKALVADYVRLNIVTYALAGEELAESLPSPVISGWLNPEIWQTLADNQPEGLSKKDSETILDVTKSLAFVEELLTDTPSENRGFLAAAFMDGYWAIQKMTMCLFTIALSSDGTLVPGNDKIVHWLCLALRDYFNEWNTSLMAHNPELDRRAREYERTEEALTDEELDAYLEL